MLYQALAPVAPKGDRKPQVFRVERGATGGEVADRLERRGLIRSALAFRLIMRYKSGVTLRAGYYRVDPSRPPLRIFEQMATGKTLARKATIPEGLTDVQTARRLQRDKVCSAASFLKVARHDGDQFGPYFPANLEGYLFPNTYQFPWRASGREAVRIMVDHFKSIIMPLWRRYKATAPLNLHKTVILASLVEREAKLNAERPIIASVYVNRIKRSMLLQCDATVQYALGKPHAVLTYADLKVDSPYNTYEHRGLPPGPIANPGKASLVAAMHPASTDYLFYVRNDVKGDGSHVFSRSYAEQQQAIRRFQR